MTRSFEAGGVRVEAESGAGKVLSVFSTTDRNGPGIPLFTVVGGDAAVLVPDSQEMRWDVSAALHLPGLIIREADG